MRPVVFLGMWSLAAAIADGQSLSSLLEEGERLQRSGDKAQQRQALEKFRGVAQEARLREDLQAEGRALYRLGQTYLFLQEEREAIAPLTDSLAIARRRGDAAAEGFALHNLGSAHWSLAEPQRALRFYEEALEKRRETKDRTGEAYTLQGMANCHWSSGESAKALEGYREALRLWKELGNVQGQADVHNYLGVVFTLLGDYERARMEYSEALRLKPEAPRNAYVLSNLAWMEVGRRNHALALAHAEKAIAGFEQLGDRGALGYAIHNAGSAQAGLRRHQEALALFERAERLKREAEDRWGEAYSLQAAGESLIALGRAEEGEARITKALALRRETGDRAGQVVSLGGLARLRGTQGRWKEASELIGSAIELFEDQRAALRSLDLRASYFGTARSYYEFLIESLARSGEPIAALEASERSRSRVLLDRLGDALSQAGARTPLELGTRQRRLDQELNAAAARLERLASGPAGERQRTETRAQIGALLVARREVSEQIRAANPVLAALANPTPVTVREIQELLEPGTILLQFANAGSRTYAWRVTDKDVQMRSFAAVHAPREWVTGDQVKALPVQLLTPWAAELKRAKRVVISADGGLEAAPWAATPLLDAVEIAVLPSASVLALSRRERGRRGRPVRQLAVFADPVYSSEDPRVPEGATLLPAAFRRLRFSREEAEAIAALAPVEKRHVALDWDASREALVRLRVRDFEILHFAAHAVIDGERPEVSGIALSQLDAKGKMADGFIRLQEILDWELRAKLVVLSACGSATGTARAGEGLTSLSRAFLHAGADAVVGTLWNVDDRATAEFMSRFYEGILKQRLTPGAALRRAQHSIRGERGWASPYYWAGFLLLGEWR